MRNRIDELFSSCRGGVLGLIGFGTFGRRIREIALSHGMTVLVCDPAKEREQSEEEYQDILEQWGNGMGGCGTVREDPVVFLPLDALLRRADWIAAAVPLNRETEGMIDRSFLSKRKPGSRILNFSDPRIASADVADSPFLLQIDDFPAQ